MRPVHDQLLHAVRRPRLRQKLSLATCSSDTLSCQRYMQERHPELPALHAGATNTLSCMQSDTLSCMCCMQERHPKLPACAACRSNTLSSCVAYRSDTLSCLRCLLERHPELPDCAACRSDTLSCLPAMHAGRTPKAAACSSKNEQTAELTESNKYNRAHI